ncbi:hypothetical protein TSUD_265860 [Trifolium subterraneum]|uniref:Uncharacterized protein n=1 Tax=Trifolium subterraneum TaxID=3900 RepID=A0A2Z6N2P9_TRISU|nr:hypothetical protein TSUD_265860 [Trifolium subterraneum]
MIHNHLSEDVFELNCTIHIELGHQSDSSLSFLCMEECKRILSSKDLMPRRMKGWNLELREVISVTEQNSMKIDLKYLNEVVECANVL